MIIKTSLWAGRLNLPVMSYMNEAADEASGGRRFIQSAQEPNHRFDGRPVKRAAKRRAEMSLVWPAFFTVSSGLSMLVTS